MTLTTRLVAWVAFSCCCYVAAYPGMDKTLAEIQERKDTRLKARSTELIGDLVDGATTDVGQTISDILQGASAVASEDTTYDPPGDLDSSECADETCCVWYYVVDELVGMFQNDDGCTDSARGAMRLGFHDAAAWDEDSSYGGADGSILLTDELDRSDNNGLSSIGEDMRDIYDKYNPYGAGMADLIQIAAVTATICCPGGPRIRSFVGRIDDATEAPTGKLPSPFSDAATLIDLFDKKTFNAADLVALVGAHSTSKQSFVDDSRAGAPQDNTPNKFDNQFYSDTVDASNDSTVLVFPSDLNLATYSDTEATWSSFSETESDFVSAYAQAYFRMTMLGLNNMNDLVECTGVLPQSS